MPRRSAFSMVVSWILTAYLVLATVALHQDASTAADRAAARLVGILAGAVGLVAISLFIRWADDAEGASLPADYQPLDDQGETLD